MTKPRKITPHKGGRDSRLYVRINPTLKAKLQERARREGVTVADLLEQWIKEME